MQERNFGAAAPIMVLERAIETGLPRGSRKDQKAFGVNSSRLGDMSLYQYARDGQRDCPILAVAGSQYSSYTGGYPEWHEGAIAGAALDPDNDSAAAVAERLGGLVGRSTR